jgi:PAS domain S-box-containing protein
MLGRTLLDAIAMPGLPPHVMDNLRQMSRLSEQVLATGQATELQQYESALDPEDRRVRRVSFFPLFTRHGAPQGVISLSEDITECVRAEQKIRASHRTLRTLVDSFPHWISVKDRERRIQLVNRALAQALEAPAEALVGRTVRDAAQEMTGGGFEQGALLDRLDAMEDEVLATGQSRELPEYRVRNRDGGEAVQRFRRFPLTDDQGAVVGVVGWAEDITEQVNAEAARRRHERVMAQAERIANLGSMEWNLATADQYWSDSLYRMLGHEPQSFHPDPKAFASFLHPEDKKRILAEMVAATSAKRGVDVQCRVVRRDGAIRIVHARGEIVADPAGGGERMVGTVQDITDRLQAEEALRQAVKLEALGRLTGGIAHDFGNLLQVVRGYAQLALAEVGARTGANGTGGHIAAHLNHVLEAAEQGAGLTQQLLTFGRGGGLDPQPVDLNRHLRERLAMLRMAVGKEIEVVIQPSPALTPILADRGMLDQVLLNLSINARDAMPGGGRLRIETGVVRTADAFPHRPDWAKAERYGCITFSDTGTGMTPEVREHLFEPFFTTKGEGEGTGLGLSVVHGIVAQHNGQILVDSTVGQGTAFHVYLPCCDRRSTPELCPADCAGRELCQAVG